METWLLEHKSCILFLVVEPLADQVIHVVWVNYVLFKKKTFILLFLKYKLFFVAVDERFCIL